MSKHEDEKQSRVPTAHRRLHTQGASYIGATKERFKCATEEQVWQKERFSQCVSESKCNAESLQVGPQKLFTT